MSKVDSARCGKTTHLVLDGHILLIDRAVQIHVSGRRSLQRDGLNFKVQRQNKRCVLDEVYHI